MAPPRRPDTAEVQAAFLTALRGGALVVAAAKEAGAPIATLYRWRGRDPLFAMAWADSAALSAAAPGRRLRFDARRKRLFLTAFEASCNTRHSCALTGVNESIVYRHIRGDPAFRTDCRGALKRGYASLEAQAAAQRAEAARAMRSYEIAPTGTITADFEEIMKLLARYQRRDGSIGPRIVRRGRQQRWAFDDAIALLAKRLDNLEPKWAREEAGEAGGAGLSSAASGRRSRPD